MFYIKSPINSLVLNIKINIYLLMEIKRKVLLIAISCFLIILLTGCAKPECVTADNCETQKCTEVKCIKNECKYTPIEPCCGNGVCELGEAYENCPKDCPNCDDFNICTTDSYDYHEQKCLNIAIVPCCGNDICEKINETHDNCDLDCPDCDDNNICTEDSFDYDAQECVNTNLTPCCGDGVCELDETLSTCADDCPFGEDEYIELYLTFMNRTDEPVGRYYYVAKNCLSDTITTLKVYGYFDGNKEGEVTKTWFEQFEEGLAERRFLDISTESCYSPQQFLKEAMSVMPSERQVGTTLSTRIYYKFEYKGKTIEYESTEEKTATVVVNDYDVTISDFAIFKIDNSNVKVIS